MAEVLHDECGEPMREHLQRGDVLICPDVPGKCTCSDHS